jgi:hypothetical protein
MNMGTAEETNFTRKSRILNFRARLDCKGFLVEPVFYFFYPQILLALGYKY